MRDRGAGITLAKYPTVRVDKPRASDGLARLRRNRHLLVTVGGSFVGELRSQG